MDVAIANFLNVRLSMLGDELKKEGVREKVENHFLGKRVFTLYRNVSGNYKEFSFDGLAFTRADRTYAYATVTVDQHYLVRHRITLRSPHLPCAMHFAQGLIHFYPLDLLDIVPHKGYYERTEMIGMSTLKSRHFRKKAHYRNYLSLFNTHRLPKVLNWQKLEDNWTLRKALTLAPEKVHPTCKNGNCFDKIIERHFHKFQKRMTSQQL